MANGNALPTTRDQPLALGQGTLPTARVPLPEVNGFSVGAPVVPSQPVLDPITGLLRPDDEDLGLDPFEVASPQLAAQPAVSLQPIPAPVAPEIEFEAEPASARAELAAGLSPQFESRQIDVQTLSQQQDDLARRGQELAFSLGTEKSPKKRLEFEKQAEDNIAASSANQQNLGMARSMRDRDLALETSRLGDAVASQQRRAQLDIEDAGLAHDREQQLDDAERLQNQQEAETDVRAAKERHAQIVERGPKQASFARTAVMMVTEALKPVIRPDGTSDFSSVVDRLMAETRDQWQREVEAAKLRTQIEGDDVGNIARARKEEALQSQIVREITARSLRLETERSLAGIQDEFQRAKALTVIDDLKRQEEVAAAVAAELAEDKARKVSLENQKLRRGEADIALTAAKIGTEQAKAQGLSVKAARDAAKSRGRGSKKDIKRSGLFGKEIQAAIGAGELDEAGAKIVFRQGVIDPVSGQLTRREDGSFALATSPEIAKDLNKSGARMVQVNRLVNEALAIRGSEGWEPTSKWFSSAAGKRMEGIATELLLVNKDILQLGVLSESDERLLERIQGGDITGLQDPRPTMRDMRRRMVSQFNQDRKSLAPGSQPLAFATVTAAPARSIDDLNTIIDQGPNLRTGDVPSSSEKLASVDEKFEKLVEESGGDIEKASRKFTRETRRSVARNQAHQDDLLDEFDNAVPDNWDALKRAAGKAALAVQTLGEDATGAEINRAESAKARTARAVENALSPRAKRLRAGIEENREFIFGMRQKGSGELRKQAQAEQVRAKAAKTTEREFRESQQRPLGSKF